MTELGDKGRGMTHRAKARPPKGLIVSSGMLVLATLVSASAVGTGWFVLDAKNNAFASGGSFLIGSPLGNSPFGLRNLPWLIVDMAAPLGAALCAVLAFQRYVSGTRYFLTVGSIAVAGALGSAALSLLAAGWMLEAGSSGVGDMYSNAQDAWYVSTANNAAILYAVAMVIAFAAGIVSLISVLRHRVAPGPIDGGPDSFPAAQPVG